MSENNAAPVDMPVCTLSRKERKKESREKSFLPASCPCQIYVLLQKKDRLIDRDVGDVATFFCMSYFRLYLLTEERNIV